MSSLQLCQKIAIYHTGALGDLLVSTAALYEAANYFPQSEITIIGSQLWKEILSPKLWPNMKTILVVKNKKWTEISLWKSDIENNTWCETPFHSSFHSYLKQFDVAINFPMESLRFTWRAYLAQVPVRLGCSKSQWSKVFYTHFTHENQKIKTHERDRYLKVLFSLKDVSWDQKLKEWDERGLPSLIPQKIKESNSNFILINPTASIREKAWDSSKFRQLALMLKEKNYDVKIIGSPKETSWLQEVAQSEFKIIQPQSIFELLHIVSQAKYLVTNTSSMQFISASTKTPTVTIMGLANPKRWGPLGSWSSFVKKDHVKIKYKGLKSKKEIGKTNEVLAYESITVEDVLKNLS